jgi:hypothetical protein
MKLKAPRSRIIAFASTGSHQGPWVRSDDRVPGMAGSLAIFETYSAALKDAVGPHMVHRCEIFIEREPASPEGKS